MNETEMQRLMTALLEHRDNNISRLARLILASGVRKNEALNAKWSDIDFNQRTWVIPKDNAKSKKADSIPLNSTAIEVLKELRDGNENAYVFVNNASSERLKWVNKSWSRFREKIGLEDITLHQLRSQFAYHLCSNHVEIYTVQKLLRHADVRTTVDRYAHLSTESLELASSVAGDCITKAMRNI